MSNTDIDLGFIDKSGKVLEAIYFVSKVGGKPSWLNLRRLPAASETTCSRCIKPLVLVCQLYCPIENQDAAFHRTIFVFICLSPTCFRPNSNDNLTVFRCQLGRDNDSYPYDAPPPRFINASDGSWSNDIDPTKFGLKLCDCGLVSDRYDCKKCSKSFCTDYHKSVHSCKDVKSTTKTVTTLPEFGLNIIAPSDDESETDEEDTMSDNEEYLPTTNAKAVGGTAQDDPQVEQFFSSVNESLSDSAFAYFKSKMKYYPDQVIRYGRESKPLWLSKENVPNAANIPKCEYCGSERVFEFQVLPQLLNYLKIDEKDDPNVAGIMDWGTLAVYTCKKSCNVDPPSYKKEYIWKQDLVE